LSLPPVTFICRFGNSVLIVLNTEIDASAASEVISPPLEISVPFSWYPNEVNTVLNLSALGVGPWKSLLLVGDELSLALVPPPFKGYDVVIGDNLAAGTDWVSSLVFHPLSLTVWSIPLICISTPSFSYEGGKISSLIPYQITLPFLLKN